MFSCLFFEVHTRPWGPILTFVLEICVTSNAQKLSPPELMEFIPERRKSPTLLGEGDLQVMHAAADRVADQVGDLF